MPAILEQPVRSATPKQPLNEFELLRVAGLSLRDFVQDFQKPRRPVILTDATRHWPARDWTPDELCRRVGHRRVMIRTESGPQPIEFGKIAELISASSEQRPAPYARNINIERELPELWQDIRPRLEYATPDWKSSRLLPRDFVFPNGLEELFFGGQGASFPRLHVDYWGMDGFISQLYGRKEVILIGPDQDALMYPSADDELSSLIEDVTDFDEQRFPLFAQATPLRLTLSPGETLYLPNGWWHTTHMPETSVTVITATWNSSNWNQFCRQYRERGKTRRAVKGLVLSYLTAVGAILRSRDRLVYGR